MSVNSSSSLNATLPLYQACLKSMGSNVIWITLTFINILFLVPLYILILHMGVQRWKLARHKPSHSDFFTYHAVAIEIIGAFGTLVYTLGILTHIEMVLMSGMILSFITIPGQSAFHLLTCVDRYLAVHPVNYMRFRETRGFTIRNMSILSTWLMNFGWMGIVKWYLPDFPSIPLFCMLSVSVIVISFCCLSVLRVLKHPGPGGVGGDKERVDQSKRRAFQIILVIVGALFLRFVGLLVGLGLAFLASISIEDLCVLIDFGILLGLPSSLVLPLLFLHKSNKLACFRHNTKSK